MISLFQTIFDLDKIFIYEDKEQNTKSKKKEKMEKKKI